MERNELLKNDGYWISKIQISLYNQLLSFMDENDMNQTELAKHLGFSKGYISQVLNGDYNYRLSKLVELSLAINKAPIIKFQDIDQIISDKDSGITRKEWSYSYKNQYHSRSRFESSSSESGIASYEEVFKTSNSKKIVSYGK